MQPTNLAQPNVCLSWHPRAVRCDLFVPPNQTEQDNIDNIQNILSLLCCTVAAALVQVCKHLFDYSCTSLWQRDINLIDTETGIYDSTFWFLELNKIYALDNLAEFGTGRGWHL